MPRQVRIKSISGIYHIMLRGVNRQQIFQDDEDSRKFLEIISICKEISQFKLFAYCFMGNHLHLLLKEEKEPIDLIVKRIGSRYVYWYNTKYGRVGHLFQDRYKSEAINDDSYFLSVLRYIHQNPVKAGIAKKCGDYKFSSYNNYLNDKGFVDTDFALGLISLNEFESFHREYDSLKHIDIQEIADVRVTDEEAKRIIEKLTNCKTVEEYQKLPLDKQTEFIEPLRSSNISIRQLSRLTGLTIGIIRKY